MRGIDGQGVPEDMGYEGHRLATRDARLVNQRPVRRRVDVNLRFTGALAEARPPNAPVALVLSLG